MNEEDWILLGADRPVDPLLLGGRRIGRGDRVRLHPRARGDVFDLALDGRIAAVESVEQDLEGHFMVSVVLDDDPGAELGNHRQPGHRFFFSPEELEPLDSREAVDEAPATRSILVAGIGNVFLGDDGFGVEAAQRLSRRSQPKGVRVEDYGIRGYDLAYALMARPDLAILVDACPRGEPPGTVYVMEPDLDRLDAPDAQGATLPDAHDMNPVNVLRLARALGGTLGRVVVVGCEPATLGPPEGSMELSEPVRAAVDEAVEVVEDIVVRFLNAETGESHHGRDRAASER
ncbi:MAG TPA: hydrogenase maturation protease [Gemmatimonadales bacterium]